MSDSLQILCPHCQQHLKVAGAAAGKQVRCPQCHGIVMVPDTFTATSASAGSALWVVRTTAGKTYGPIARDELAQWVREGRVDDTCHVARENSQQWIRASEMFPQLAPLAATATAPSPRPNPVGPVSDRSQLVAGLLGLLLPLVGLSGVHRLYLGHIGLGIVMLITCGGCGIWQLIDVILVFAGAVRDVDGLPLRP